MPFHTCSSTSPTITITRTGKPAHSRTQTSTDALSLKATTGQRDHCLRSPAYSYRVVRSIPPLNHERGTLTFTPSADGTHVDCLTSYTHPAYAGGKLMEAFSGRLLRFSFLAVLAGCTKALES